LLDGYNIGSFEGIILGLKVDKNVGFFDGFIDGDAVAVFKFNV